MCRCLRFFQFVLIGFLEDGVDASAPAATCCFTSLPLSLSSSSFPRRDASRYYLNRGGVIGLKNDGCSLMNTAPHDNQVDIEKSYSEHHAPPWCPSLVVVADSRRKFLRIFVTRHILFATCCLPINKCYTLQQQQQDATAATTPTEAAIVDIGLLQESSSPSVVHVESLKIVRILGKGAYNTVYLVVVDDTSSQEQHQQQRYYFALAVEPVRTKTQVKESLRGIQIAAQLEQRLVTSLQESAGIDNDAYYFERIVDWWFQPFPPVIITSSSGDDGDDPNDTLELEIPQREQDRSKKPPSRFLGTQWLVALKPVYDMDLKSFIQHSPLLYPVGGGESSSSSSSQAANPAADVSSLPLLTTTETAALNLLRDVCHAGKLMHAEGLVHLDIKPKNIMLRSRDSSSSSHHHDQQEMTQPVLIDFGFSRFVKQREQDGSSNDVDHDLCFVEPGRVRGEVGYVLAQDVALYQACQRGDVYAMGKTMYEVLFLDAFSSGPTRTGTSLQPAVQQNEPVVFASAKRAITASAAQDENDAFRHILFDARAGAQSRFHLSTKARDFVLSIIRAQCRDQRPISFDESERLVLEFMQKRDKDAAN